MKIFWFIALMGFMAGCTTERHEHHTMHVEHHPPPMYEGMGPGSSPALSYYHDASKNLFDARQTGYLSNEQFVNLLGKLQAEVGKVMVAEGMGMVHGHPMCEPPGHPKCHEEEHHRHHHEHEHEE